MWNFKGALVNLSEAYEIRKMMKNGKEEQEKPKLGNLQLILFLLKIF